MTYRSYSLVLLLFSSVIALGQNKPVFDGGEYTIFRDRVEQGVFTAKVKNRDHILSNYKSPANQFMSPRIDFKFSINGADNEMRSGMDHHFSCVPVNGRCETPLIVFGQQLNDETIPPAGTYLRPDTPWKVRLDMRPVFSAFEEHGFYDCFDGTRIYRSDFKGVYIAGNTTPLTWDFDNLHNFNDLQLFDEDGDHIYERTLILNSSSQKKETKSEWKRSLDIGSYPQYTSSYPVADALYNLSLEEMIRAVEKDSTLRTGKEWAGVWTRDVSYSIILSMAILQPKVAQYSLLRKVKDGVIVQDTGTGGAYPVSTDRMVWAIAAWEIYKVTGDNEWLKQVYPIIKRSLEADLLNAMDPVTGLVRGESSFLDWREQTYPLWMQPSDIFESQCLGTNAVHYQAHCILSAMAGRLNDEASVQRHALLADGIRSAMNRYLWLEDKGYYGQYRYGRRFKTVSPRSEALGEALAVLFDIADPEMQKRIVERTPVGDFGIPCIYPQIPNIPPYHNDATWPFVQAYWAMASAKAGNELAVMESFGAMYRPAALFLTNKENFVLSTGDFAGTQINSDNMLWSLSGNIAMVYKILFGIHYDESSLRFSPFVPKALSGKRSLTGYTYRDAVLDIEMSGHGNKISKFLLDGKEVSPVIASTLKGRHTIRIILAGNEIGGSINKTDHTVSPETPSVTVRNSLLQWSVVPGAVKYKVLKNGAMVSTQSEASWQIKGQAFGEYQVIAVDSSGIESFCSEPVVYLPSNTAQTAELENLVEAAAVLSSYRGYSGSGYVETNVGATADLGFTIPVPDDGLYAVDFRYANGNGPVNTENKCAIRTLVINDGFRASVVFPQRGKNEWSNWGFTNPVIASLKKGENKVSLLYEPHNLNMNGEVNGAVIDYVRLIRIN
jgi:hypothetical protein